MVIIVNHNCTIIVHSAFYHCVSQCVLLWITVVHSVNYYNDSCKLLLCTIVVESTSYYYVQYTFLSCINSKTSNGLLQWQLEIAILRKYFFSTVRIATIYRMWLLPYVTAVQICIGTVAIVHWYCAQFLYIVHIDSKYSISSELLWCTTCTVFVAIVHNYLQRAYCSHA